MDTEVDGSRPGEDNHGDHNFRGATPMSMS